MLEQLQIRIGTVDIGASMRLTCWLPGYATVGKSVVLAGRELPTQVGATLPGPIRISCVGPREWLILSREKSASSVREQLKPDLSRQGLVLVDLTHGIVVVEARGSAIRELLSKGCGLDFHPRTFPAGRCARTRFAQISLIIDCPDELSRFELTVARSYYHYLQAWIADAAVEFEDQMT